MAEQIPENKSMGGRLSPSGTTQSPRSSALGCDGVGINYNSYNNGGTSGTGLSGATGSAAVAAVVNETTLTTRSATASVDAASVAVTPAPSPVPPSTWSTTLTLETGATAISATGGDGFVPTTLGGSGLAGSNAKTSGGSSPRSPKHARKSRIKLSDPQLESASKEDLAAKWREQDLYVECLEAQAAAQEGELSCLRDSEEKYRQQCCEASHRERILVRRLASKEQQLLGYVNQITEMRAGQAPSTSALRSALLDPAVNILVQKLRQELLSTKAKLEDTQNELSAWKFTPDSNTGKRLMAKCRLLYQENEELGRMIASGRIAKLEGELVLQKSFSEEVKKSQSELDEFLQDLDEDVEGMQSTIYFLQQELRKARESVSLLQQENDTLKTMSSVATLPLAVSSQPPLQSLPPQQPLSPSPLGNEGLSNGAVSPGHTALLPKVETTNDENVKDDGFNVRSSGDTKPVDPAKRAIKFDRDDVCNVEHGGARAPMSVRTAAITTTTTTTITSTSLSSTETKSDCPEVERGRRRPDEPDESSNDSAALIIKVENEELSDREEDEDETAPRESRGHQRQSSRIRDRTPIISESLVGSKSNGDERTSSRPSSRRLLRERTAKRDKSSADSDDERLLHKKKRRESILSLDYTETDDDALLLTNGETIQSDPEDGQ